MAPGAALRIGTRRSALAIAQAEEVAAGLRALGHDCELVPMVTSGDRAASPEAGPAGMKGLFVHEIVKALIGGEVDLAVHSAKDLPSDDPDEVVVAAVPERGSPFDVLLSREAELPEGATVGSSSLRRRGQLLRFRPDLRVTDVRGNVDTRLRKMAAGEVDGLVLAAAGLARLGVEPEHAQVLGPDAMVPAPGQGALAVQTRSEHPVRDVVARIDHQPSRLAFEAERLVVSLLGGGCSLPLGALATVEGPRIRLVAVVLRADGSDLIRAEAEADSAEAVAREASDSLLGSGAAAILGEVS